MAGGNNSNLFRLIRQLPSVPSRPVAPTPRAATLNDKLANMHARMRTQAMLKQLPAVPTHRFTPNRTPSPNRRRSLPPSPGANRRLTPFTPPPGANRRAAAVSPPRNTAQTLTRMSGWWLKLRNNAVRAHAARRRPGLTPANRQRQGEIVRQKKELMNRVRAQVQRLQAQQRRGY